MRARIASREEDMSPDGKLEILMQDDGDVIVNVKPSREDPHYRGSPFGVSVEFCSVGSGGGRSIHTLKALRDLFSAIEKDNAENPQ
ncbi:hypothetical protein [Rosistilla oblonga]|uniref:Uncharacterized protein n=1 Tax=Rosistilla oblonga TaxID=2527990 RepID=A0A518J130_9BACT|nr:hypothetical protein [Rosistilla oblonga]QDV59046.1 hypothetical protein Mal33_50710 [Rosistilla oblonga]